MILSLMAMIHPFVSFADDNGSTNALAVNVMTVQMQQNYEEKRIFVGQVEAGQTADTGFELSGTLQQIKVDEGDQIAKGDVLAVLDRDRLEAQREEAAAALQEAETFLPLTEASLKRVQSISRRGAVSEQEVDEARQARDGARAAVRRQKAILDRIDVDLQKSALKAPFDAIVVERLADEGRVIEVGSPVLRLKEQSTPEARVALANGLADHFDVGDSVVLKSNNRDLNAVVKSILPVRNIRTRTVDVIFTLSDDTNVRPGDLVELSMNNTMDKDGFWVPLMALSETIRGLWSVYIIDENGLATRKIVDLIYQTEEKAFVRGNFQNGESIIAAGVHRIIPGQAVTAVPSPIQNAQKGL